MLFKGIGNAMQSLGTELNNSILTSGNHKKNITLTKHLISFASLCFLHSFWKMCQIGCYSHHIKPPTSNHILGASWLLNFYRDLRKPSIIGIIISTCETFLCSNAPFIVFGGKWRVGASCHLNLYLWNVWVEYSLLSPGSSIPPSSSSQKWNINTLHE